MTIVDMTTMPLIPEGVRHLNVFSEDFDFSFDFLTPRQNKKRKMGKITKCYSWNYPPPFYPYPYQWQYSSTYQWSTFMVPVAPVYSVAPPPAHHHPHRLAGPPHRQTMMVVDTYCTFQSSYIAFPPPPPWYPLERHPPPVQDARNRPLARNANPQDVAGEREAGDEQTQQQSQAPSKKRTAKKNKLQAKKKTHEQSVVGSSNMVDKSKHEAARKIDTPDGIFKQDDLNLGTPPGQPSTSTTVVTEKVTTYSKMSFSIAPNGVFEPGALAENVNIAKTEENTLVEAPMRSENEENDGEAASSNEHASYITAYLKLSLVTEGATLKTAGTESLHSTQSSGMLKHTVIEQNNRKTTYLNNSWPTTESKLELDPSVEGSLQNRKVPFDIVQSYMYIFLQKYIPTRKLMKKMGFPIVLKTNPEVTLIKKWAIRECSPQNKKKPTERGVEVAKKNCMRCGRNFFMLKNKYDYVTLERCQYHWGKPVVSVDYKMIMECCGKGLESKGCTIGKLHVWSGLSEGINRLTGFKKPLEGTERNIIGLDCEMVFTKAGLEVANVALVDINGKVIFQTLVETVNEVIDFNSRFSGIFEQEYRENHKMSFKDLQEELQKHIKSKTIIVGHGLENDLRVLKIVHPLVADTAFMYPHHDGLPKRRSLKAIAKEVLLKTIQDKVSGHDPAEDAKTVMRLVLEKVYNDMEKVASMEK